MTIIEEAVDVLSSGGVIAYPTEYCFGLGCDPNSIEAIKRILDIKQRSARQGLILIASDVSHINEYAQCDGLSNHPRIMDTWPGPVTWLLPAKPNVSTWLRGEHQSIAMRVTAHQQSRDICSEFSGAIVSTSANRHGETAMTKAADVVTEFGSEVDYVVDLPVGDDSGVNSASQIYDGITGQRLR